MTTPSSPNDPIPNAAFPTAGQGLTLDLNGKLPQAVLQTIPGYEYAYTEFTSPVTANTVAEASATQIVTAGAINFDGTPIRIEFFCPALVTGGATNTVGVNLWDATTDLGRLFDGTTVSTVASNYPGYFVRKLTPTVASHTYSIRIWSAGATNFVASAGAGGVGVKLPGFIRITHA